MLRSAPALALFALMLALYAWTMPSRVQDNHDAVEEAHLALMHDVAPRPNHLLLTPTNQALVRLVGADRPGRGRPFLWPQLLNTLAGAAAVALLYRTLRNLGGGAGLSLAGTLLMAFSWAHWMHSRESESAMISQAFANAALWLACRPRAAPGRGGAGGPLGPVAGALAAGAALGLSVLYAMNCVLIAPALFLAVVVWAPAGARLRAAAALVVAAVAVALPPYVLAAARITSPLTPGSFLHWVLHHPNESSLSVKDLSLVSLMRAAAGLVNYFTGYTGVTTALKQIVKGTGAPALTTEDWLRFGFGLLVTLLLAVQLLRLPRSGREASVAAVCWVGFAGVAAFNVLWLGSDPQFWLPGVPFLVVQACAGRAAGGARGGGSERAAPRRALAWALAACAAVLFGVNFFYPVPTFAHRASGAGWRNAEVLSHIVKPGDLLLDQAGWGSYLRGFGPYREFHFIFSLHAKGHYYLEGLDRAVDSVQVRGRNAYALGVFDPEIASSVGTWEQVHAFTGLSRRDVLDHLKERYRPYRIHPELFDGMLWKLESAPAQKLNPSDSAHAQRPLPGGS
ncbi:MAG TPA: hypothetical protein VMS93_14100 [Candidatus Saccharimonadales bacterium]|nr:hypothetical protein [Candidatus Saccharimonadales bacterium]